MICINRSKKKAPVNSFTIHLFGSFSYKTYASVTIGSTKYTAAQDIEVAEGTLVRLQVSKYYFREGTSCYITLNGKQILTSAGIYAFTVSSDVNINYLGQRYQGAIEVTT